MHEGGIPEDGVREYADQQHLLFRKIVQVLNVFIGYTKHHPSSRFLDQHHAS